MVAVRRGGQWPGSVQWAAPRRDLLCVETEPVHSSEVSAVFHLHATVHHDDQAVIAGNLGALAADDAVLQPQHLGANRRRLTGDRRNGGRAV